MIVGQRLAAALWPGTSPVGRSFSFLTEHFEVVGVAKEINHPSVDVPLEPGVLSGGTQVMMNIRCESACPDLPLIRQRLTEGSSLVRMYEVRALDSVYFKELATPRAAAAMGLAFAAVNLGTCSTFGAPEASFTAVFVDTAELICCRSKRDFCHSSSGVRRWA